MLSGDVSVPVWLGLVVTALTGIGLYAAMWGVHDGLIAAWEWVRRGRVSPLLDDEDEPDWEDYPPGEGNHFYEEGLPSSLPPERSREELGFTGEQPVLEGILWEPPGYHRYLTDTSERLEPAWQAEIVSAQLWWEELPSGSGFTREMAAQVRELAS